MPGGETLAENLEVLRVVPHGRHPTGSEDSGENTGRGVFGWKPKAGDRCWLKTWNSPWDRTCLFCLHLGGNQARTMSSTVRYKVLSLVAGTWSYSLIGDEAVISGVSVFDPLLGVSSNADGARSVVAPPLDTRSWQSECAVVASPDRRLGCDSPNEFVVRKFSFALMK